MRPEPILSNCELVHTHSSARLATPRGLSFFGAKVPPEGGGCGFGTGLPDVQEPSGKIHVEGVHFLGTDVADQQGAVVEGQTRPYSHSPNRAPEVS